MAKCRDCGNDYEYDRELDCPVCNECLNKMLDEVESEQAKESTTTFKELGYR